MADETITNFTSITGSTPALATQYLRLGDNDLEQAIGLYYANDGADLEPSIENTRVPPVPSASTRPPGHGTSYTDDVGVVHLDSDNDNDPDYAEEDDAGLVGSAQENRSRHKGSSVLQPSTGGLPQSLSGAAVEDDEAMAMRLQQEMYGHAGNSNVSGMLDEESIRAPIARTTQTLVGPDGFDPSNEEEMRAAVMEQMMARRQPRPQRGRHGIFNQDTARSVWDDVGEDARGHREQLARATAGASETSSKASTLAELYRPPFELINRITWDEARERGKANEKWILVNIQDISIFDCQVLNRDIWKNPSIIETVRENFIFMQYNKEDRQASQYLQYYFPNKDIDSAYPHVAIVDPRTGEQVKVWSGPPPPRAPDFLMQLHEFLDRYSLKALAKNPVAKRKPEARIETNIDRMTEEQQMEMAMRASLTGDALKSADDPDELTRSVGNLDQEEDMEDSGGFPEEETLSQTNGITATTASPFSQISSTNPHTEPANGTPGTARIAFRHPNGRIVRRFSSDDPVRRIYEWLKSDPIDGKAGMQFELISSEKKNLMGSIEESIQQAGLNGSNINIEFESS